MLALPDRLARHIHVEPNSGCWLWVGPALPKGYGMVRAPGRGNVGVHRHVFELLIGPIPGGLHLDHLCRTPPCCNPDHLEPVSSAENTRRGEKATRTHCVAGHEFTEANTYHRRNGTRMCRACVNRRSGAAHAKRRNAVERVAAELRKAVH